MAICDIDFRRQCCCRGRLSPSSADLDSVWSLVSTNEELARTAFLRVANHAGVSGDGIAAELSAAQMADLYCLLAKIFPPDEAEQKSGTVTPRMEAGYLRDRQLQKN